MRDVGEHISLRIGMPGMFGEVGAAPSTPTGKPPKLSDLASFAEAFSGIS